MRLLLNMDNDITRFNSWMFVRFSMEDILFSIGDTLRDLNLKNLLFLDLLPFFLVQDITCSFGKFARYSLLSIHTWTHLRHLSLKTSSSAVITNTSCS